MTMVGVLVASVIMASVAVGLLRYFANLNKAALSTQQSGDFLDAQHSARLVLYNNHLCRCNLAPGGGAARTFSASDPESVVIDLATLQLFDENCNPGSFLVDTTGTPNKAKLQITSLQLTEFFRVDDTSYVAKLRLRGKKISGEVLKDFNVGFATTTSGGTVTLVDCAP